MKRYPFSWTSPYKLREYEDEEWDWQELYSMYGDGSMDFENEDPELEKNGYESRE